MENAAAVNALPSFAVNTGRHKRSVPSVYPVNGILQFSKLLKCETAGKITESTNLR